MSRIVSVWLPRWPVLHALAQEARQPRSPASLDPELPFVLTVEAAGGPRIAALNAAAELAGLAVGQPLADARAKVGPLQARPADPAAAAAALQCLALWATRYTPRVSHWDETNGADGIFLDITGADHLFGGESGLLGDLACRLQRFGLSPRLAVAGTPGAAHALSRFHAETICILPPGQESAALAPLPIEALRLSPQTRATLRRLGFKRVGPLIESPRAPFAARFPAELLERLDQAHGRRPEPLACATPPPVYHCLRQLIEPIAAQEAIVAVADRLMRQLVPALVRDGVGARRLQLVLYRVDGDTRTLDIALSLPTRSPAHVSRLIALRLDRIAEDMDAGFGFEAVGLFVVTAERMPDRQTEIASAGRTDRGAGCAALIDGLRQRLGPGRVRRLQPVASPFPERAETACAATAEASAWSPPETARLRPPLLLARAEPAEVVALVPDGPPRRFRWRGVTHAVARAQGPERIAAEWWRHRTPRPTRDYYLVENDAGRRFWLYREGLYGRETTAPRWFVHGLFG